MGRLLRKKTAFRPKKKENGAETVEASLAVEDDATVKAKTVVSAPLADKKWRAPAVQKPAGTPIAFPGRDYLDKAMQFLREVKVELKKVAWPSRKQTIGSTAVVVIIVMIMAFFLGLVDFGLNSLVRVVLQ